MTSNIVARDVSYEDAAPISDGSSLRSGEVLCQGCIKFRQELYQASTNVKSAEEIIRILHDEINSREWWMQQIEAQAACPVVKNKYLPKHTLKAGLRYL